MWLKKNCKNSSK